MLLYLGFYELGLQPVGRKAATKDVKKPRFADEMIPASRPHIRSQYA
jgi:hypothetical protein